MINAHHSCPCSSSGFHCRLGVAFSLHATLSPSSQSSTVADEAATNSKIDSVAVIEGEPPQDAMPAAVLRSAIEASRTNFCGARHSGFSDGLLRGRGGGSEDRTALEITSGPPPVLMAARVEQPIDQAASDQPAPAPKSTKQKSDFDQLPSASSLGANTGSIPLSFSRTVTPPP